MVVYTHYLTKGLEAVVVVLMPFWKWTSSHTHTHTPSQIESGNIVIG
jgi:hypothetical protein